MTDLSTLENAVLYSLYVFIMISIFPLYRYFANRHQKKKYKNKFAQIFLEIIYIQHFPYVALILWILIFCGAVMQWHSWVWVLHTLKLGGAQFHLWLSFIIKVSASTRVVSTDLQFEMFDCANVSLSGGNGMSTVFSGLDTQIYLLASNPSGNNTADALVVSQVLANATNELLVYQFSLQNCVQSMHISYSLVDTFSLALSHTVSWIDTCLEYISTALEMAQSMLTSSAGATQKQLDRIPTNLTSVLFSVFYSTYQQVNDDSIDVINIIYDRINNGTIPIDYNQLITNPLYKINYSHIEQLIKIVINETSDTTTTTTTTLLSLPRTSGASQLDSLITKGVLLAAFSAADEDLDGYLNYDEFFVFVVSNSDTVLSAMEDFYIDVITSAEALHQSTLYQINHIITVNRDILKEQQVVMDKKISGFFSRVIRYTNKASIATSALMSTKDQIIKFEKTWNEKLSNIFKLMQNLTDSVDVLLPDIVANAGLSPSSSMYGSFISQRTSEFSQGFATSQYMIQYTSIVFNPPREFLLNIELQIDSFAAGSQKFFDRISYWFSFTIITMFVIILCTSTAVLLLCVSNTYLFCFDQTRPPSLFPPQSINGNNNAISSSNNDNNSSSSNNNNNATKKDVEMQSLSSDTNNNNDNKLLNENNKRNENNDGSIHNISNSEINNNIKNNRNSNNKEDDDGTTLIQKMNNFSSSLSVHAKNLPQKAIDAASVLPAATMEMVLEAYSSSVDLVHLAVREITDYHNILHGVRRLLYDGLFVITDAVTIVNLLVVIASVAAMAGGIVAVQGCAIINFIPSKACGPVVQTPISAVDDFGSVEVCNQIGDDSICTILKIPHLKRETTILIFGSIMTMIAFWHLLVSIRESYHSSCRREQAKILQNVLDANKQNQINNQILLPNK